MAWYGWQSTQYDVSGLRFQSGPIKFGSQFYFRNEYVKKSTFEWGKQQNGLRNHEQKLIDGPKAGVDVINMLHWNNALLLDKTSRMTFNISSECFISALCS